MSLQPVRDGKGHWKEKEHVCLDLENCHCDHLSELRTVGGQCPLALVGFLGLFSLKCRHRQALPNSTESSFRWNKIFPMNILVFKCIFSLKTMHSTWHLEQLVKLINFFLSEALIYLIPVYIILAFGSISQSLCRPISAPPPFSFCFCNQRNCCFIFKFCTVLKPLLNPWSEDQGLQESPEQHSLIGAWCTVIFPLMTFICK